MPSVKHDFGDDSTQLLPANKEDAITPGREPSAIQGVVSDGDPDKVYDRLVMTGREVISGCGWMLGDLAAKVESAYGESKLAKYAYDIGTSYKTVLNTRTVARAWPQASRRPELSFSVAATLAAQSDRVDLITKNPDMTVSQARKLVQDRKGALPESDAEPAERDIVFRAVRHSLRELESSAADLYAAEVANMLERVARKLRKRARAIEQ